MADIIAGISILVDDRKASHESINNILSNYGLIISGRMGIPHLIGDRSVISLILQGDETSVDSLVCDLKSEGQTRGFHTVLAKFED